MSLPECRYWLFLTHIFWKLDYPLSDTCFDLLYDTIVVSYDLHYSLTSVEPLAAWSFTRERFLVTIDINVAPSYHPHINRTRYSTTWGSPVVFFSDTLAPTIPKRSPNFKPNHFKVTLKIFNFPHGGLNPLQ